MDQSKLNKFLLIILFVSLYFSTAISQEQLSIPDTVNQIIKQVQQKYHPDKRISLFEVTARMDGEKIILTGEILSLEGKSELISRLKVETNYQIEDSLLVLPDPALEDNTYGVVRISVAQLRRNPDIIYEIVDQAMMGTEVRVLKLEDKFWAYCQLDDEYIGWMTLSSLKIGDKNFIKTWRDREKLVVTANYGQIWEKPTTKSIRSVSDVVKGNILINRGLKKKWYQVELPDSRVGYIQSNFVTKEEDFRESLKSKSADDLLNTAYQFIGMPYLWGGRSTKGFDCSGFTQTVYKLNGIALPRDANMQVQSGVEVTIDDSLKNLTPGDLLFFGKDIDHIFHVGIYIGDDQFIHSDGLVRFNSFNPRDENYSEYRRNGLQAVRRILNSGLNIPIILRQ